MLSCSETFKSYWYASIKTLLPNMACFVALFHLKLGICPCISSTEINSLKCFHKQTGMTTGILPIPVHSRDKHKQTPREHLPTPYGKQAQSVGTLGIQGLLLPLGDSLPGITKKPNKPGTILIYIYWFPCWEMEHAIVHGINSLCLDGQLTFVHAT